MKWEKIGFVDGNGTTNAPKEYSFTDKTLTAGTYLYRLKQVDRNGEFSYSHDVEVTAGETPKGFSLEQNYPNPFNPGTKIVFSLPVSGFVSLIIYDMVGREVQTVTDEVKEAGEYTVTFSIRGENAAGYSSGIYSYTLHAGNYSAMKKMIHLK